MKTIYADYNAATEDGYLCLTTRGSQADVERAGVGPGDWVWLSDREVVVGARLQMDDRYGLVGVPDWDTMAHLDEDDVGDYEAALTELRRLFQKPARSSEEESRVLELLTIIEVIAPREVQAGNRPGYLPYRCAASLALIGKPELRCERSRKPEHSIPDTRTITASSCKSCVGLISRGPGVRPKPSLRIRRSPPVSWPSVSTSSRPRPMRCPTLNLNRSVGASSAGPSGSSTRRDESAFRPRRSPCSSSTGEWPCCGSAATRPPARPSGWRARLIRSSPGLMRPWASPATISTPATSRPASVLGRPPHEPWRWSGSGWASSIARPRAGIASRRRWPPAGRRTPPESAPPVARAATLRAGRAHGRAGRVGTGNGPVAVRNLDLGRSL